MERATLEQALHVLKLITDQDLSREQLRAVFNSGYLSWVFEAVKSGKPINPAEVRRGLGLEERLFAFKRDMCKEGWKVVEDVGEVELLLPDKLELVPFLIEGKKYINREELVRRVKEQKANLGQRQAEYLFEHQEEIPKEWRQYYLVFTGTIWRGRYGPRRVPCLVWRGGRWCFGFYWLGGGFGSRVRLVRPRE